MRALMAFAGPLLAAAIVASPAAADMDQLAEEDFEVSSGRDLLELCNPVPGSKFARDAIHVCHGVVLGAYGVHEAAAVRLGRVVCPPKDVTRNDGVRTFVSWAKSHPTTLDEPAIDVLFRAWAANYPCPAR